MVYSHDTVLPSFTKVFFTFDYRMVLWYMCKCFSFTPMRKVRPWMHWFSWKLSLLIIIMCRPLTAFFTQIRRVKSSYRNSYLSLSKVWTFLFADFHATGHSITHYEHLLYLISSKLKRKSVKYGVTSCPPVKYSFHCTNFHATHCSTTLHGPTISNSTKNW